MEHLGKGFINMLIISMPIVLTAAGIGLVIGILQAVTQVQEQTIAAAPKILGVSIAIMVMGGFFVKILSEYLVDSVNLGCTVVTKQGNFVLPPEGFNPQNKNFFTDKKIYSGAKKPNVEYLMKNPGKIPYTDNKQKAASVTRTDRTSIARPNLIESKKLNGN